MDFRKKYMKKNVLIFPTSQETADALAEFLVKEIDQIITGSGNCTIALSGGNTPRILFAVLADKYSGSVDWPKVDFFWVDERCVAPDDPQSNYGMTKDSLLDKIIIPSSCIHRIHGEDDPEKEALRYADEIKRYVTFKNGFPSFDIILLGMGDDGHTASIFPGSESLFQSGMICVAVVNPLSGQKRVTITGSVINNGSIVLVFATGKGKSGIISELLGSDRPSGIYPISRVAPADGRLLWYIDRDAGGMS